MAGFFCFSYPPVGYGGLLLFLLPTNWVWSHVFTFYTHDFAFLWVKSTYLPYFTHYVGMHCSIPYVLPILWVKEVNFVFPTHHLSLKEVFYLVSWLALESGKFWLALGTVTPARGKPCRSNSPQSSPISLIYTLVRQVANR